MNPLYPRGKVPLVTAEDTQSNVSEAQQIQTLLDDPTFEMVHHFLQTFFMLSLTRESMQTVSAVKRFAYACLCAMDAIEDMTSYLTKGIEVEKKIFKKKFFATCTDIGDLDTEEQLKDSSVEEHDIDTIDSNNLKLEKYLQDTLPTNYLYVSFLEDEKKNDPVHKKNFSIVKKMCHEEKVRMKEMLSEKDDLATIRTVILITGKMITDVLERNTFFDDTPIPSLDLDKNIFSCIRHHYLRLYTYSLYARNNTKEEKPFFHFLKKEFFQKKCIETSTESMILSHIQAKVASILQDIMSREECKKKEDYATQKEKMERTIESVKSRISHFHEKCREHSTYTQSNTLEECIQHNQKTIQLFFETVHVCAFLEIPYKEMYTDYERISSEKDRLFLEKYSHHFTTKIFDPESEYGHNFQEKISRDEKTIKKNVYFIEICEKKLLERIKNSKEEICAYCNLSLEEIEKKDIPPTKIIKKAENFLEKMIRWKKIRCKSNNIFTALQYLTVEAGKIPYLYIHTTQKLEKISHIFFSEYRKTSAELELILRGVQELLQEQEKIAEECQGQAVLPLQEQKREKPAEKREEETKKNKKSKSNVVQVLAKQQLALSSGLQKLAIQEQAPLPREKPTAAATQKKKPVYPSAAEEPNAAWTKEMAHRQQEAESDAATQAAARQLLLEATVLVRTAQAWRNTVQHLTLTQQDLSLEQAYVEEVLQIKKILGLLLQHTQVETAAAQHIRALYTWLEKVTVVMEKKIVVRETLLTEAVEKENILSQQVSQVETLKQSFEYKECSATDLRVAMGALKKHRPQEMETTVETLRRQHAAFTQFTQAAKKCIREWKENAEKMVRETNLFERVTEMERTLAFTEKSIEANRENKSSISRLWTTEAQTSLVQHLLSIGQDEGEAKAFVAELQIEVLGPLQQNSTMLECAQNMAQCRSAIDRAIESGVFFVERPEQVESFCAAYEKMMALMQQHKNFFEKENVAFVQILHGYEQWVHRRMLYEMEHEAHTPLKKIFEQERAKILEKRAILQDTCHQITDNPLYDRTREVLADKKLQMLLSITSGLQSISPTEPLTTQLHQMGLLSAKHGLFIQCEKQRQYLAHKEDCLARAQKILQKMVPVDPQHPAATVVATDGLRSEIRVIENLLQAMVRIPDEEIATNNGSIQEKIVAGLATLQKAIRNVSQVCTNANMATVSGNQVLPLLTAIQHASSQAALAALLIKKRVPYTVQHNDGEPVVTIIYHICYKNPNNEQDRRVFTDSCHVIQDSFFNSRRIDVNGLFDLAKAESLVLHPEAEEVFQSCICINGITILTLSVRCGGKVLCAHQQVMPSTHASPHKTLYTLYFQKNTIAHMLDGSTDENKPFSGRHRKSSFLATLKKHKKSVHLISREGYQSSGLYFYFFHFSLPTKPEEHIVKTVFDDQHPLYKNQGMEKLLMQAAVAAYALWSAQKNCQLMTEMVYHHLIAEHTYLCLKARPMDNTGFPRIIHAYPVYSRKAISATFKYAELTEEMVA